MASQLTLEERERISQLVAAGESQAEIARELGRAPSTICRELRRNSAAGDYLACTAHHLAQQRRRDRPLVRKLDRAEVVQFVRRNLLRCWSPDQIAGRTKREFPNQSQFHVSHQTIYTWIGALPDDERSRFRACLRRAGRRRPSDDRRGKLVGQVSIQGRPQVVDQRRRYGDWEGDTIVGARQSGAIVTLVERKSGYLLTAKSCDRQAWRVAEKIRARLGTLPSPQRRTLTFDNGKEFAQHQSLAERLAIKVYFADPYCSWQRGTHENTNGLLRQFIPKRTDFSNISWQALEEYTHLINDRPRKRLGYRTPAEVFEPLIASET